VYLCVQGLRPYSAHQAIGANLLRCVNKGQYGKTDAYWAHAQLSPEDRADVLLITTRYSFTKSPTKFAFWRGGKTF